MTTPSPDIEELEKLAKAATPGPWVAAMTGRGMEVIQLVGGKWTENVCQWTGDHPWRQSNMHYIAAANPQAILTLLNEKRALEEENVRLKAEIGIL